MLLAEYKTDHQAIAKENQAQVIAVEHLDRI
jgi:hypothetical protein